MSSVGDGAPSIATQMQNFPSEHVHGHHSHFHNFRRINLKLGTNILHYNALPCFKKFGTPPTGRLVVSMAIFVNVEKGKLRTHY